MKKKFSIFVSNGLGNQLFVYSYIYNLMKIHGVHQTKVDILFTRKPREWTPFYLNHLIDIGESEINFRKASGFRYFLRVRLPKAVSKLSKSPNLFLSRFRIYVEEKVFFFYQELIFVKPRSVIFGSFISNRYVELVWEMIEPNLLQWLGTIKYPEHIKHLIQRDCIVMHVRRGDTVKVNLSDSRGLMGKEYYRAGLNQIKSMQTNNNSKKVIVVTDDLPRAKEDLLGLKIDFWFGPSDLDAISALKFMVDARYFIGCNSTLSWWAAKMQIKFKNGSVFLPKPWYANVVDDFSSEIFIEGANYIAWND